MVSCTLGRMCTTYSCSHTNVLSKHDTLRFDDEEVDQLLNVVQGSLEGLLGEFVVASRTNG